jgi:hypothetical protein
MTDTVPAGRMYFIALNPYQYGQHIYKEIALTFILRILQRLHPNLDFRCERRTRILRGERSQCFRQRSFIPSASTVPLAPSPVTKF